MQKVTDGQNKLPNDGGYLNGIAPDEVADDDAIRAKLREKNAEYAQFNKERMEKRAAKLEEIGQFRAMTSRGGAFTRGSQDTRVHCDGLERSKDLGSQTRAATAS